MLAARYSDSDPNAKSSVVLKWSALLLLMLDAVSTDLVHHQPEAQHPKIFSYPQAQPADYPILSE
jgi:hypothetical protein